MSFRLPLVDVSSNKLISEVSLFNKERESALFLKKLRYSYSKAPYFKDAYALIENVLNTPSVLIGDLAQESIRQVFNYLDLPIHATSSSSEKYDRSADNKTDRLISLIHHLNKKAYLNAIGGKKLYDKEYFKRQGIDLYFIVSTPNVYNQFNNDFVPDLSMIDVLMFNHPLQIISMLDRIEYE
jgi:hypothetical protein